MARRKPNSPQPSYQDLHFPAGGVNATQGHDRQINVPVNGIYQRTTVEGLNVRGYDTFEDRCRGGSRAGVVKHIQPQVNGNNSVQDVNFALVTEGTVPGTGNPVATMLGILGIFPSATSNVEMAAVNSNVPNPLVAGTGLTYFNGGRSGQMSISSRAFLSGSPNTSYTAQNIADGTAVTVSLTAFEAANAVAAPDGGAYFLLSANQKQVLVGTLPGTKIDTTATVALPSTSHIVVGLQTGSAVTKLMACSINDAGSVVWSNTNAGMTGETLTTLGRYTYSLAACITGSLICLNLPSTGIATISLTDGTGYAILKTPAQLTANAGDAYSPFRSANLSPSLAATSAGQLAIPMMGSAVVDGVNSWTAGLCFIDSGGTGFTNMPLTGITTTPAVPLSSTISPGMWQRVVSDGTDFYWAIAPAGTSATGVPNTVVKKVSGTTGLVLWTATLDFTGLGGVTMVYLSGLNQVDVYGTNFSVALNVLTGAVLGSGVVHSGNTVYAASNGGSVVVGATTVDTGTSGGPVPILVAVAGGTAKVSADGLMASITGGAAFSSTAPRVRSAFLGSNLYYTDGVAYKRYRTAANTMEAWTPTAGTIPVDSNGRTARLIVRWREAIMLAGWPGLPYDWALSARGFPDDWDFAPASRGPDDAVRGQGSEAGVPGDAITCLIPCSNDVVMLGCNHSIEVLSGDPLGGGRLDTITRAVGIAFGSPWAQDPSGGIYFFSNTCGIYRMEVGGSPVRVSQPIDGRLRHINLSTSQVVMAWNDLHQSLHVFVTPFHSGSTTHYTWESRANAWWEDEFANPDHSPLCVCAFEDPAAPGQTLVMGSFDGYLRTFSSASATDDGYPISWSVMIGPLLTAQMSDVLFRDVQAILGIQSDPVTFEVYVGATCEQALASTPAVTGTFSAGRSKTKVVHRSGHALYLRLSGTGAFAMESIKVYVSDLGKIRGRGA